MALTIDEMLVVIDAQTERMRRELKKGDKQVEKFDRNVNRRLKNVDGAFNRMNKNSSAALSKFQRGFGAIGAAFGVGVIASIDQVGVAIREVVRDLGQLSDQARKVGVTTEQLQVLRFAAEQNGVAISALDVAIQRFSRRVGEADKGTGELVKILQANNIATRDAAGNLRPVNDVLRDYAELIRRTSGEQAKLALAFKAFDTEGAALVLALENGKAGLDAYAKSARELGIIIDKETIAEMKKLDDQFTAITRQLKVGFQKGVVTAVKNMDSLGVAFKTLANLPQFQAIARLFDLFQKTPKLEITIGTSDQRLIDLANNQGGQPGQVSPLTGTAPLPRFNPRRDETRAGQAAFERSSLAVDKVTNKTKELKTELDAVASSGTTAFERIGQSAQDAFSQIAFTGNRVLDELISKFLSLSLQNFFGSRPSPTGLGGSAFAGATAGFALPGFQTGGSFKVPGAGGSDSQLVAFRATPGEQVDVMTRQQQQASVVGGNTTVQVFPPPGVESRVETQQVGRDEIVQVFMDDPRVAKGVRQMVKSTPGVRPR